MLAYAQIEFGLSEREFWKLTPAKYWALMKRRTEQVKRRDYRAGIITRVIRQALGAKQAGAFDDFAWGGQERRKEFDKHAAIYKDWKGKAE